MGPMGILAPSVEKPVPRLRLGFVVAFGLVMAAAVVFLLVRSRDRVIDRPQPSAWSQLKPHCTPLEVETALREQNPSPVLRAVCFAVAGKIERAREIFVAMPADER